MTSVPKSFGSQLQLNKIPILGVVVESASSAPSSPVNGQLWYDTSVGKLKMYEAGSWFSASTAFAGAELSANKGAINGYAGLDGSALVPTAQLPIATSGTSNALLTRANDSRLSDSRAPTGTAGGSLTGTYPNPTIAALAITDSMVAAANKDGVAGTASLRTLGTGATQALGGTTRLDQLSTPTASVGLGSQKITSLADPTAASDAATKAYVDALIQGLDAHPSVRVASSAAVTVTYSATGGTGGWGQLTAMPDTIDGVTLVAANRVLLKDQATAAQNGVWVVTTLGTGANGVWNRATDFTSDSNVSGGAFLFVEEGTANADTGWVLTNNGLITVGGASGASVAFAQFSSAGTILGGAGLVKTGNTLDVVGTSNRISVAADSIDISTSYVGQASITTLGTITTGTWTGTTIAVAKGGTGGTDAATARSGIAATGKYAADLGALVAGTETVITHSLGTSDVHAMFRTNSDGYDVIMSWRVISTTQIGVTADLAYGSSAVRVTVIG